MWRSGSDCGIHRASRDNERGVRRDISQCRPGEGPPCLHLPRGNVDQLAAPTDVAALDFERLRQEIDIVRYLILPLVDQMAKQWGEAGRHVHRGATTQDIMDTATVLQLRAGFEPIERDIAQLRKIQTSSRHAMAGRSDLQQALPVNFGYKTAIWLAMFENDLGLAPAMVGRVVKSATP